MSTIRFVSMSCCFANEIKPLKPRGDARYTICRAKLASCSSDSVTCYRFYSHALRVRKTVHIRRHMLLEIGFGIFRDWIQWASKLT